MRRAKITKTAATSGEGEAMSATVLRSDVSDLVRRFQNVAYAMMKGLSESGDSLEECLRMV